MSQVRIKYDATQHCTAYQENVGKTVAADSPPSCGGAGRELSPLDLVGSALGSCMLLSMGTVAVRDGLDLTGARVDVDVQLTPRHDRIAGMELTFAMPKPFRAERDKLERAAALCPIKPSLHPDVRIATRFRYPQE